jgi:hypothetical protein
MGVEAIPIIISLGFFAMVAFIAAVINSRRQTEVKSLAEVQNKLLDKFGSSKEFVDFLQADGGKSFLTPLPARTGVTAGDRIIRKITIGTIATLLGVAFIIMSMVNDPDMAIPGSFMLAIGLGFLISAVVAHRLSRSWGLINDPNESAKASV